MKLEAKVKSGLGEGSFWVKKIEEIFLKKENIKLFHGTLNLELENDLNIEKPDFTIEKEEYGGTEKLFVKKCTVLNQKAYIIRTEKNSKENGDHPLNVIEILSNINFREKYSLKDEDKVAVEV